MTKLVVVLAVVVVVILVIVIIAARSMRAEDPEEFADRPGGRGGEDDRYERRERQAARGGRPAERPGGARRPAGASASRRGDGRRDLRSQGSGHGGNGHSSNGRGGGPRADERRADPRTQPRPAESRAPAGARGRRSGDSSEWDSSQWEKLSDVDYWAELAADKPLTTTAQPAAQARSRPDLDTEALTRRGPAGAPPRQDPATGLPVRRPQPANAGLTGAAARSADFTPPVPADPRLSRHTDPRLSRHTDPAGLPSLPNVPSLGHSLPPGRRRVNPDDDPLTSPSFPRIPPADSRSYGNGRADTPPRGSSAPYLAPTQQFAGYGSPAPDYPASALSDTDNTNPNGYRPDPLNGDRYPAPAGPPPSRPALAAPPAAGNPYGSYVTPDSPSPDPGYGPYSGAHAPSSRNGHGSYPPSPLPGDAGRPAGNSYWQHQPSVPGGPADPRTPDYSGGAGQYTDALGTGNHQAGYRYENGYPAHDQAGYPPGSYPPGPHDQAGYPPLDPYGRDGSGGYPGSGAAGR
jgi:hypothetical protein